MKKFSLGIFATLFATVALAQQTYTTMYPPIGGTHVFKVTYGATGTPTTTLVIAMPAAPADWVCPAVLDRTSTSITGRQSGAASATTVSVTWSSAPANGDVIELMCGAL